MDENLLFYEDVLRLERSDFKLLNNEQRIQPTKAILNPPYEDKFKPIEIIEKNISLLKDGKNKNKLVVILPPQKFGQNKETFSKILTLSTLEIVIKTQDDLFIENKTNQSASIFVFNTSKPHSKNDIIHYYDFTDTGYIYLKDSGLVDKNHTFEGKKKELLNKIKNASSTIKEHNFFRNWSNFYEIDNETEIDTKIDPLKVKLHKDEADITLENIKIKNMLKEKKRLLDECKNNYKDIDGKLEEYILKILSEN